MDLVSEKKKQLSQHLLRLRESYSDKRVVFVSGNFNIVHPGHLRLLNFAKACGDILVIGLSPDDTLGVLLGFEDRKATLLGLESVSEVFELPKEMLIDALRILRPDTVVKGKEHEDFENIEQQVIAEFGGHLVFSSGEQRFSSQDLIRSELRSSETLFLKSAPEFLRSNGISTSSMTQRIQAFQGVKVIVIGDLIVDEYIYCDPLGMSQEDPTIVVTPVESKKFIGGAGIVASHLVGLGAEVSYFSIVGRDDTGRLAKDLLLNYGVDPILILDESRPTSLKQRFRSQNKTLLRVSHLRSHEASLEYWIVLLGLIKQRIYEADMVVFSDFNYGCLPQNLVNQVSSLCREVNVPFVADSQASSQVSNVSRFSGADFLSATEREARLAVGDFRSGLQNVSNLLFAKSRSNGLFVKLGPEGLILVMNREAPVTVSLPALNSNPVDVAGAGDAFLSVSALCRATGAGLPEAAYLGSVASAIQVGRQGNIPLRKDEILGQLRQASQESVGKALSLDRDDVISRDKGFVHRVEDIKGMPGALQGMRLFSQAGFELIIVTNQPGIARGYFSETQQLELQNVFEIMFQAEGVIISKTYYCPHHPQGQVAEFESICDCRKPGLLLEAQRELALTTQVSVLLGDKASDMVAAETSRVGRCYLIGPCHGTQGRYQVFPSVHDVVRFLLA